MTKYIELTEKNYFEAINIGCKPMDWIERQATKGSDVLNNNSRVMTYDGILLDFRRQYNIDKDSIKVDCVKDLKD